MGCFAFFFIRKTGFNISMISLSAEATSEILTKEKGTHLAEPKPA